MPGSGFVRQDIDLQLILEVQHHDRWLERIHLWRPPFLVHSMWYVSLVVMG